MRQKFELLLENILDKYNIYGDDLNSINILGYLLISYPLLYLAGYFFINGLSIFIVPLVLNIGFYFYSLYIFTNSTKEYEWDTSLKAFLGFLFVLNLIVNLFICFMFFGNIVVLILLAIYTVLSYSQIMLFLIPIIITYGIIILLKNKEKSNV
jgi:hypothetical protein